MNLLGEYRDPENYIKLKPASEDPGKEDKTVVEITVKKVLSPSNFWAQIIRGRKCEKKFGKLKDAIKQYFNDPTFSKTRVSNPTEGQRCIVKTDDKTWHRAVINKVFVTRQGFMIHCNLVDEVEYTCVPAVGVYETPLWVWDHPIQSACFGLYGIAPTRLRADYVEERMDLVESKNTRRWDQASCRYFESLCSKSESLKAHLIEKDSKNVFWVKLFVLSEDDNTFISINEELVKQNYATIRSMDKHDLNSAGESEESGCEGKYISPKRYKVLRDKMDQLLKENTMDPRGLSDSSDDSDFDDVLSKGSSYKQNRANDVPAEPRKAPHKVCGQGNANSCHEDHLSGSGDFNRKKIEEKVDGTLNNMVGLKKSIGDNPGVTSAELSGFTQSQLLRRTTNGVAACGKLVDFMGVSTRSAVVHTGLNIPNPIPNPVSDDLKDSSMQVDFDNQRSLMDFTKLPRMKDSDVKGQTSMERMGPISLTDGHKVHVAEGAANSGEDDHRKKIDIERADGWIPGKNEFYMNAPKFNKMQDSSSEDTCSSSEDSLCEEELAKPIVKKAENSEVLPLKTVFIPDNLHSGSVILVRGQNPPNPISLFRKAPFSSKIQGLLEVTLRYKGPRLIQAHAWPAILANRDVVAIAPRGGGKTLAYAAPVIHMVVNHKGDAESESRQPIAIIVTPDWADVQRLHELFEVFFSEYEMGHKVVAVYGGTPGENAMASEIASGCSVLICTAPSLVRICKAKYANLNRLKCMVLDNVNVLVEKFTDDIKELMKMETNMLTTAAATLKSKKRPQLICMGSQWTEGVESFTNRFIKHHPLLLISHPLEAAVYGKVQHKVMPCRPGERTNLVTDILYLWEDNKEGGMAIFVDTPKEVDDMQKIVESLGFYALKAHSEMCQWELDEVRRQFDDESSHPVLVTTDEVITELDIYTMQMVIHFTFPSNQHRLGIRLSAMQTFFRNKLNAEDPTYARSFFLMSTQDSSRAPDLVNFLQRLGQPVSQELQSLANLAIKTHESTMSSIPLCRMIKSFGQCRDEQICLYRHQLSPLDKANTDSRYVKIPTCGHVRVQVTHVVDATHYYVRLLAVRNESGEIFKYEATHAKITMDLAIYFSGLQNDIHGLGDDPLPGVIYALKHSYDRVVVLQIRRPDTLNSKDFEEWTVARKQASNASAFVCWTTPGGARKTCARLVDTGSIRIVRCDDLLGIPKKFCHIPFQAVETRVAGVRPIDKDTKWLAQADEYIHQNLYNKEIEGNIIAVLDHTMWLHPVVVRSKLPLTNCVVMDFNVAAQLSKTYGDKNTEQIDMIKTLVSGMSSIRGIVRPKPSRFPAEHLQRKSMSEIFSSSKALENANHAKINGWVESMKKTEPGASVRRDSRSSETSTLSSQSSTNYHPKVMLNIPSTTSTDITKLQTMTTALQRSANDNIIGKLPIPRRLPPIKLPNSEKAEESPMRMDLDRQMSDRLANNNTRGSLNLIDQPQMKPKVSVETSSKYGNTSASEQSSDPGHALHVLGPLCDRFCATGDVAEKDRLKMLHEIHMRSVGSFYDMTVKDLKGLAEVFNRAQTEKELRIIVGALLSLALDEVPVASFLDLAAMIKLACSIPNVHVSNDDKRISLMEIIFRLCRAMIDSLENNCRVAKNRVSVSELGEMIMIVEKYLRQNGTGSSQALNEADCVLEMLRDYRNHLMGKEVKLMKESNKTEKEKNIMKGLDNEDPFGYNKFRNIDTGTDSESLRPFSPIVCNFDSTDGTETSDTETLAGAHLL